MKSDKELINIIASHEKGAIGGESGELANERGEALDRYFGRLYGNELDGRSKVVSKDISDAVDWIMPSMLRVFLASDNIVRFDPVGPEDMEASEQESDYVNHVMMKDNNGFCVLHDWFKDALLLKNGYVKHWWDVTEEVTHETYTALDMPSAALLLQTLEQSGDEIEIVAQDTTQGPVDPMTGMPTELYDIKFKRTRKKGKLRIEPTPPEEVRVSNRTRTSLQDSPFIQHITRKTRSELIEMGLPKAFVDELPTWSGNDYTEERISRDSIDDENTQADNPDRSMQEIEYKESYVRVDADDDGIAELRKVVIVGNRIPKGSDWNHEIDSIPFSSLTPNRLPHRHIGLSVHDELKDIAEIKTALIRGTLDNTYQLINSEWLVNERVNLSDFLQSRPNGVKRVLGKDPIGDSAVQVNKLPIIQNVIPVLDYMDTLKETRSGVGKNVMGLDSDTLKKTTEGAARMALQQANSKIEMIARVFAETGVKDLALAVHALLIKHQDKAKVVQIRSKWIQVNPQEWKTRTDMTVAVGLGTGSQEEVRANLMQLADIQERAAQAGIVGPKQVFNLANRTAQLLGFKQEGEFFMDPESDEAKQFQESQQQPPENQLAEAEKVKGEFKMQSDQMKQQLDHANGMQKLDFERYKFEQEHGLKIAVEEIKALIAGLKAIDLGQPGLGTETQGQPQQEPPYAPTA